MGGEVVRLTDAFQQTVLVETEAIVKAQGITWSNAADVAHLALKMRMNEHEVRDPRHISENPILFLIWTRGKCPIRRNIYPWSSLKAMLNLIHSKDSSRKYIVATSNMPVLSQKMGKPLSTELTGRSALDAVIDASSPFTLSSWPRQVTRWLILRRNLFGNIPVSISHMNENVTPVTILKLGPRNSPDMSSPSSRSLALGLSPTPTSSKKST